MLLKIAGTYKALNSHTEEPFKFTVCGISKKLWCAVNKDRLTSEQARTISKIVDTLISNSFGNCDSGIIYTVEAIVQAQTENASC